MDQPHALQVGDEVDRLGHGRELVRPDGEEQEDRLARIGPNGVAEHAERVVIGPLHVVDQQRQRLGVSRLAERYASQVEGAQQLGISRKAFQPWLIAARHGLDHPLDRCLCGATGDRLPQRRRREDALGQQERATDLLVRGHRDGREPGACRELRGGQQQAGLANPRLALQGHRGQVRARTLQLVLDRRQLRGPAHDRASHAAELDAQRALRLDSGIEGTTAQCLHPGELGRLARRIPRQWGGWRSHVSGLWPESREEADREPKSLTGRGLPP